MVSGCLPGEPVTDSGPAVFVPSSQRPTVSFVGNPTDPAAYLCGSPRLGDFARAACATHFEGTGIAVEIPTTCIDTARAYDRGLR